MQSNYFTIEEFENVFLEDSWVLRIRTDSNSAEFLLDVVLTEKHPLYTFPKQNEQYCYKQATINFPEVVKAIWVEVNMFPYKDLDGEIDFGNIDSFIYDGEYYNLSGDWGELKIQSAKPTIKFIES